MYVLGYIFVLVLIGVPTYFVFKEAKETQKTATALGLMGYGLFGLAYGARVGSLLVMFLAAALVVVGLEWRLRDFKQDIFQFIGATCAPKQEEDSD